jgi:hypothetical protein
MSFLAGLSWGRRAGVVLTALEASGAAGQPVSVVGSPRLVRALTRRGRQATLASATEISACADDSLPALIAAGDGEFDPSMVRAVRPGGAMVFFTTLPPVELSRRALCAGLVDVEQRFAGRYMVMSGRVWKPRRETAR